MIEEKEHVIEEFEKPGTLLQKKRESLGLSQQQVADRLRLRVAIIEAIEANNFELDKVNTFIRGYVRSYARAIGVSEHEILSSYDYFVSDQSVSNDVAMKSFSSRARNEKHNSRNNLITLGILLIVVGISSVWWYQNQQLTSDTFGLDASTEVLSSDGSEQNPTAQSEESDPIDVVEQQESLPQDNLSQESAEAEENVDEEVIETESSRPSNEALDTTDVSPTDEQSVSSVEDEQSVTIDVPSNVASNDVQRSTITPSPVGQSHASNSAYEQTLTMFFDDDCWIQVKDSSGKTVSIGLKKAGTVLDVKAISPLKVVLGAPKHVRMTFAGEPVDLSGYTSGKVARFTLP